MADLIRTESHPSVGPRGAHVTYHLSGEHALEIDRHIRRLIAVTEQATEHADKRHRETVEAISRLELDHIAAVVGRLDERLDRVERLYNPWWRRLWLWLKEKLNA